MQHSRPPSIPSHTPSQGRWNDRIDRQVWKGKLHAHGPGPTSALSFGSKLLPPHNVFSAVHFQGQSFPSWGGMWFPRAASDWLGMLV